MENLKKNINYLKQSGLGPRQVAELFKIFETTTVSASVIAGLIGTHPRTVAKYYHKGFFKRESDGNYNLIKTLNHYINYVKDRSEKNQQFDDDRKKLIHYKAEQEEIKTLQMKKELAPIAMIKHFYSFAELMIQKIHRRFNKINPEIEACYLTGEKQKAVREMVKELETLVKDSVDEMRKEMMKEGSNYQV